MALWNDLVRGTPALESDLSLNAKEMKADMYAKLFDESTDMNHDCKVPGSVFLRCLKSSATDPSAQCGTSFNVFDACRKSVIQQQASATSKAMMAQDLADKRAKALFDRRSVLVQALTGQPASAA
jgi:hypothetical protein